MAASENQRTTYRDKFKSLFNDSFQAWLETLLKALHPAGDFQAIRKTAGDGGLDGFVISSQLVYQAYAPARIDELRDSETAGKIHTDFAKAKRSLAGQLKRWTFIHNHPEAKMGKRSIAAINRVKKLNPEVVVAVLDIDSLWEKLSVLPEATLARLFGAGDVDDLHAKLLLAEEHFHSSEAKKAEELFKEVAFRATSVDSLNDRVTALLGLFVIAMNRRDDGAADGYLRKIEDAIDKVTDVGLRIHTLRAKANLFDHRRNDTTAEDAYREALAVPATASDQYVAEAIITTKVDFALFLCRTKRLNLAEPLIRECEAHLADLTGKVERSLLPHIADAVITYSLCLGDEDGVRRGIRTLEERAGTQPLAEEYGLVLERLGQRSMHLKAYSLGILCCQASARLAHKARRDDNAVAAQHVEITLLCEKGNLDAAKEVCEVLLAHVRSSTNRVLHTGVADLWARISHRLGDHDTAALAAEEALSNVGDNLMATVGLRHNLAEILCDAGRVEDGLDHAQAAYTLAKKIGAESAFIADLLFLIAHAACLIGDWNTTQFALAELAGLPEWSEEFEQRRKSLVGRIGACQEIRSRIASFASDPIPLDTAGTALCSTIWEANIAVVAPLISWWEEMPGPNEVPPGYDKLVESQHPKNLSVLYDYWGRGSLARVLLNLRGFSHTFTLTVEAFTLSEVERAVRMFSLLSDVLIILWKGPLWSQRVVPIVPAFNNTEGGAGYIVFPTDPDSYQRKTEKSGDWFPAVGDGSFLPDDVISFLWEKASPLLKQGRLFVIPASAVGCVYEGHGPFDNLFAELCGATPVLRGSSSKEFPLGWVPYFPDAPLQAIADVVGEAPEALRRLRLLLMRRTRELRASKEVAAASIELETEIVDALAQLKDLELHAKRKHGWTVQETELGDSAVAFTRKELLGAAWRNGAGSYLYAGGRPNETVLAAEWTPILTLRDLGHRWQVASTAENASSANRRKARIKDQAVGAWLAPRGHDIRIAMVRAKAEEEPE